MRAAHSKGNGRTANKATNCVTATKHRCRSSVVFIYVEVDIIEDQRG